ncbi:MAG: cell surface protein SprA, partial [Bacteroidales bacterium]
AQLIPHTQDSGSSEGSSYLDDFESTQTGIDLRSPYSWFLSATPYDTSSSALFPESALSNNLDYGKNRALLSWYYIDDIFTDKNSTLAPSYIKNDLDQQSSPYIRQVTTTELYPDMELSYGESSTIQTLNLSFYPTERGPYNLDSDNIDDQGNLLNPEDRWGGIMRKLDNTNFETSNIEYITFWMLSPFLDEENPNYDGGDLYFNLGEVSEDILKDGMKSYENGVSSDDTYMYETVWGKVSTQNSLTYAFDSSDEDRVKQDVGLNGLHTDDELTFSSYVDFISDLRLKLSPTTIATMEADDLSVLNDPAGDNYHFYRGYDYDAAQLSIHERYKRYNGVEGNSLSSNYASDALYQSSRSVPDVEDINQDNTLNEYERYYQYHISVRPEDFVVGQNYITDKQVSMVSLRNGEYAEVEWYQFKIPVDQYEKVVGSISDFSSIRFMRMFMTGFKNDTHIRFATLELVRGEWRTYDYSLNSKSDATVSGALDVSVVNIEENAGREPVNYILPPGVTRVVDSSQSQVTQLNEQSISLALTDIDPGDARGVYKNSQIDLRLYKRLQMFVHAEALIDDVTNLADSDLSVFIRMGSDVKSNYYEYEIPLAITPAGNYSNYNSTDQYIVWPLSNQLDCELDQLVNLKSERIAASGLAGVVSLTDIFSMYDPNYPNNKISILGNPSLSNVSVMLIGIRNNSSTVKDAVVWINELKVTDFNEDGGWAAKGNLNLAMSDIATLNVSAYRETDGFGAVDQSLSSRATDNTEQYNVAVQADLGRFLPEKVKLKAPVYYSVSNEKITPKYNPLDQDVLLEDALESAVSEAVSDSIKEYAISSSVSKNLSVSGLKFDIQSKNPMPWDPANFTFSYSSSKQSNSDSTTEYENQSDYRGSLDYTYSPYVKGLKPFSFINSKSKDLKFIKDWELNYLPTSIGIYNNISRYYYELQSRNLSDVYVEMPVSVSKNFVWDREFSLTWNLTKQLTMTFNSNTMAYIQEAVGAVNKDLYPTEYEQWRDTVWNSIKNLGDPYEYNQNFSASYKLPFSKIPSLSFISGSVSYSSSYDWDKGVELDGTDMGNTISNQSILNIEGKFNLEQLYNKSSYLKGVNTKFTSKTTRTSSLANKTRKFTRTFMLKKDEPLTVKHNMKTKSVKVVATTTAGKPFAIEYEVIDANSVKIKSGDKNSNIKVTVTEVKEEKGVWSEIGDYAARVAMSVRNLSFSYRQTQSLSLPQFAPTIGGAFGQNGDYSILSPGLDFAFGFAGESYIDKAKENGWLLCDDSQTSPAVWSDAKIYNFEINLEPISGLKIKLTANQTDNRTNQTMFMYDTPTVTYSGSYTKTHCTILTSLYTSSSSDGYQSDVFDQFLDNINVISKRFESNYIGTTYPNTGFLENSAYSGKTYSSETGGVRTTSSDITIPAFIAAYTGTSAETTGMSVFPSLSSLLPNWRVTYDGLVKLGNLKDIFKSFTLSHAYQCTYSVGSFSSYTDWVSVGGDVGFIQDEITGAPIPSSPYEISSVSLTEKFSPLLGVSATLQNNVTLNVEYNDGRTLTLSSSAGQLVEAKTNSFVIGAGYKIANFNTVLKIGGSQKGVSNDLTLNLDFSLANSQALIRNIEYNTAQASSGTRTVGINFLADYILSKRVTVGAYYDMQSNNPLVSSTSYPTSSSNYGVIISLSLAQ